MSEIVVLTYEHVFILGMVWSLSIALTWFVTSLWQTKKDFEWFDKLNNETHQFYREQIPIWINAGFKAVEGAEKGEDRCLLH